VAAAVPSVSAFFAHDQDAPVWVGFWASAFGSHDDLPTVYFWAGLQDISRRKFLIYLVGAARFELAIPSPPARRLARFIS
jgi:hypothetical protein